MEAKSLSALIAGRCEGVWGVVGCFEGTRCVMQGYGGMWTVAEGCGGW